MRRIIALLLTVVMALSLVVVAGATDDVPGTVNLEVTTAEGAKPENGVTTELVYYVYLKPQGDAEVGVAQFTLTAPAGTKFKSVDFNYQKYVYNDSGVGIGSGNGIFAKDAITNVEGGDLGGHFENGGTTFKAALAGTVRKDTVVKGEIVSKRMLTSSNCNEWLYKLTVTLDAPYNENNSYVVGIDKSSLKAGYNRNVNEPTTTTDITLQHTINVSSKGYGGMWGDVNGDGSVNGKDVSYLNRYLVGWAEYQTLPSEQAADVNGDGQINGKDVSYLNRYLVGWTDYPARG